MKNDVIGSFVKGIVDRPMGTAHPGLIYEVNYGYVSGVYSGDGEEQDAYILGAGGPIESFEGRVIAIYHRSDDVEDKWIVSLDEKDYSDEEILEAIRFQERFFRGELIR